MVEQVTSDYIYLRSTGDTASPQEEPDVDKIETYQAVISALREARDTLFAMNESQGRTIDKKRAARCRVVGARCARALEDLQKAAEL